MARLYLKFATYMIDIYVYKTKKKYLLENKHRLK